MSNKQNLIAVVIYVAVVPTFLLGAAFLASKLPPAKWEQRQSPMSEEEYDHWRRNFMDTTTIMPNP